MVDEICNIIESSSLDDVRRMAKYKQQWINLISDAIRKNASITTLSQARTFIRFFYCGTVIQFIIIKATIWYLLQFDYNINCYLCCVVLGMRVYYSWNDCIVIY